MLRNTFGSNNVHFVCRCTYQTKTTEAAHRAEGFGLKRGTLFPNEGQLGAIYFFRELAAYNVAVTSRNELVVLNCL